MYENCREKGDRLMLERMVDKGKERRIYRKKKEILR
jgi:hypothetical protein